MSRSSEDVTTCTTIEGQDHQSNGHLVSSVNNSPQVPPYASRHRRGSIDSSISKNLTINYERSNSTTSSSSSSRPLSPADNTNKLFTFESLQITNRPQTSERDEFPSGGQTSSVGIPHKYSDPASHDREASPQFSLPKGHTRASSVGGSPMWSQKGHRRAGSHCTSVSQ